MVGPLLLEAVGSAGNGRRARGSIFFLPNSFQRPFGVSLNFTRDSQPATDSLSYLRSANGGEGTGNSRSSDVDLDGARPQRSAPTRRPPRDAPPRRTPAASPTRRPPTAPRTRRRRLVLAPHARGARGATEGSEPERAVSVLRVHTDPWQPKARSFRRASLTAPPRQGHGAPRWRKRAGPSLGSSARGGRARNRPAPGGPLPEGPRG